MRGDRSSVLHRDSRDVSDHHEGVLRFRPRLFSRGGIPVLPGGVFARRLRNDTVSTSRMAGPVLQAFHHHLSSCRVNSSRQTKKLILLNSSHRSKIH